MTTRAEQVASALAAHGAHEIACDLEATMATVGAEPHYEWRLANAIITFQGRGAVEEMYRRLLSGLTRQLLGNIVGEPKIQCGEAHAALESLHGFVHNGVTREAWITAIVDFDENLHVVSERSTVHDPYLSQVVLAGFGEGLEQHPGVSMIRYAIGND